MRLTLQTDYSFRVLMYLGVADDRLVTIQEISSSFDISRNHLMKVVHHLAVQGYIRTVRGKHGGMRLGRMPADINVSEVVRVTEPDLDVAQCFSDPASCRLSANCRLSGVFGEATRAFMAVLSRYTLEDLLAEPSQLSSLLALPREPEPFTAVG